MLIRGTRITLYNRVVTGIDAFNRPIYDVTPENVDNVIIEPIGDQEVLDVMSLTGRKVVYRLHLPKGDAHDWTDRTVTFFGQTFRTVGEPIEYQEELVPLEWNRKVQVERIE